MYSLSLIVYDLQSRGALCCVASHRVASRQGLFDHKIHSLPTSNFTTTALYINDTFVWREGGVYKATSAWLPQSTNVLFFCHAHIRRHVFSLSSPVNHWWLNGNLFFYSHGNHLCYLSLAFFLSWNVTQMHSPRSVIARLEVPCREIFAMVVTHMRHVDMELNLYIFLVSIYNSRLHPHQPSLLRQCYFWILFLNQAAYCYSGWVLGSAIQHKGSQFPNDSKWTLKSIINLQTNTLRGITHNIYIVSSMRRGLSKDSIV